MTNWDEAVEHERKGNGSESWVQKLSDAEWQLVIDTVIDHLNQHGDEITVQILRAKLARPGL